MNAPDSLHDFLSQLRDNDEVATKRFVDLYSPMILHLARPRLRQHGLSRVLDPEDIAQEVFARFFLRVVRKRVLASAQELTKLLVTIAINVIRDEQRGAGRLRRGSGQPAKEHPHLEAIVAPSDEPIHELEIDEEIEQIHKLLSDEEWNLAWARAAGKTWEEIAAESGQSADALRKKLSRALARVTRKLNPKSTTEPPPPPKRPRRRGS